MDDLELFPDIDLGAHHAGGDGCTNPIGNRAAGLRRRAGSVPPKSAIAGQVQELRLAVEAQHEALMDELRVLRQQRRDAAELPAGILRRLVEIERHLRLVEIPQAPRIGARRPLDG